LEVSSHIVEKWEQGLGFPPEEKFHKIPKVYKISEAEWSSILEEEL
jgi:hypothetical protein